MKRFLIIFAICFASVIGVFAGVFGVKYLKGDFNEKVVYPENFAFELDEYDVTGDFKMKITTTTEDVTATKIKLEFAKGTTTIPYKDGYITDKVIIIPEYVNIGVEFDVKLYTINDQEVDGKEWIKGGVSRIKAKSEYNNVSEQSTTVYVDVPVYKTEIVVLSGNGSIVPTNKYSSILKNIESQSGLDKTSQLIDGDSLKLNAGDTFYAGIKFYPERSAYKYSKISSTNLLVEYETQINQKLAELGMDYSAQFNTLKSLFSGSGSEKQVNIQDIISAYSQIVGENNSNNQFASYLNELNQQFISNLKYYSISEMATNENTYINIQNKVFGTNLYKMQATTNSSLFSGSATTKLNAYTFFNSYEEDTIIENTQQNELIGRLDVLWSEWEADGKVLANKKVDKTVQSLTVVDVDVDTITISGSVGKVKTSTVHTIYATNGTNSSIASYLNISLSNSIISNVDLQGKVGNVGIRFEKKTSTNSWGKCEELEFVDKQYYKEIFYVKDGVTYSCFLPIQNSYWQIYSNNYISEDIRICIVFFNSYSFNEDNSRYEASSENLIIANDTPIFKLEDSGVNEKIVGWTSTEDLNLSVINMNGVIDMSGEIDENGIENTKTVSYNTEIDLSKLISIPTDNFYKYYKFFIYSDNETAGDKISTYFYATESGQYVINGLTLNLYELENNGYILKLKGGVPSYNVKVIFATLKTDANLAPIKTNGIYQIVKYSAVKDGVIEKLSALNINFETSLDSISGEVGDFSEKAGVVELDNETTIFKVAQNSNDVFSVTIDDINNNAKIVTALTNGTLRIEAREAKNNALSYISYTITSSGFKVSVLPLQGDDDVVVRLYFVYNVDGADYLFPITITKDGKSFNELTIVKKTSSSAEFNFTIDGNDVNSDDIEKIFVSTTYQDNKFSKSYQVFDADAQENRNINIFTNDGQLSVKIINFLGVVDVMDKGWFVKSSNSSIISVQDDGQSINFVGSGIAVLTLCLGDKDNYIEQASITLDVASVGYVNQVTTSDGIDNKIVYQYDENKPYSYTTQHITLERNKSNANKVDLFDSTAENKCLFSIEYKIPNGVSDGQTIPRLPMEVYIADESTKNELKEITGKDFDMSTSLTSFTLTKDLGKTVTLNFLYKNNALGITQKVVLKLAQTINISNVVIAIEKGQISQTASVYNVYKGVEYTITIDTNSNGIGYYVGDNKDGVTSIDNTLKSFSYIFNDNSSTGEQTIHIVNMVNDEYGLDYTLTFNVQDNLIVNKNIDPITLTGSTATISLSALIGRKSGSGYSDLNDLPLIISAGDTLSFGYNSSKVDNKYIKDINVVDTTSTTNIIITFAPFSSTTNKMQIQIYATFDDSSNDNPNKIGGTANGDMNITILPENLQETDTHFTLYKNAKAIIVENGQEIETNTFVSMFANGVSVSYNGTKFENIYLVNNTVTLSNLTNLFTDTETYVVATKDGISTQYKIIISKLKFPFVKFVDESNEEISYNNLDVYDLFVESDDLVSYYKNKGIKFFTANLSTPLTLVDYTTTNSTMFTYVNGTENKANFTDYGTVELINNNGLVSNYLTVEMVEDKTITLVSKQIGVAGGVYVKVSLKVAQKSSDSFSYIPIVVYLEQSQKVIVNYPNGTGNVQNEQDTAGAYGSSQYDEEILKGSFIVFENSSLDYVLFDAITGTAQIDLLKQNRIYVTKYTYDTENSEYVWEKDESYNGGYYFYVERISKNVGGVWSYVDIDDFDNYVSFAEYINSKVITISRVEADAIRVKIRIVTEQGASNYYYISAGEVENFKLMKKTSNASSGVEVGSEETITVKSGDVLVVGGDGSLNFDNVNLYYYLSNLNYNQELKFRLVHNGDILNIENNEILNSTGGKSKFKVQPLGINKTDGYKIEIYTLYGVLTTLNVVVEPAYNFTFTTETLYSGTAYSFSDLVEIEYDTNNASLSGNIDGLEKVGDSIYYDCDNTEKEITFNHIATKNTFDLRIKLTLGGEEFEVVFNNITIQPRITHKSNYNIKPYEDLGELTNYAVDGDKITLSKDLWNTLFKDVKDNSNDVLSFDDLYFCVKEKGTSNEQEWESVSSSDLDVTIGAITSTIEKVYQFIIKTTNGEEIALAFAKITVKPEYSVQINYPLVMNDNSEEISLDCEYVQNGAKVDLSVNGKNINGDQRIIVTKTNDNAVIDYTVKLNTTDIVDPYQFSDVEMFPEDLDGNTVVEFGIYVNNLQYATYIVKVMRNNASPFSFTSTGLTVYATYGDDDVFNYVDFVVTLPESINNPSSTYVELYMATEGDNSDGTILLSDVFYKSGEKIRLPMSIKNYYNYINNNCKIFVKDSTSKTINDKQCVVTKTERGSLTYAGKNVRYCDYEKIVGKVSITEKVKGELTIDVPLNNSCSIATSKLATNALITYAFDVEVTNQEMVTLNANESVEGHSLILLFGIKDSLGNPLGINQIANKQKTRAISLTTKSTGVISCLPIEPQYISESNMIYDYMLKPVGASNDGTIVTLTFKYTAGSGSDNYAEIELKVKVVSDVVYELYNNDGSMTSNSELNPLKVKYSTTSKNITLASATETSYVYAYSKFAGSSKPNIVHTWGDPQVVSSTGTDFFTVVKENNAIMLKMLKQACFGNKTLTVKFTDPYNFTFTYYIEMIADYNVESVNLDNDKFFEGDSVYVYNKGSGSASEQARGFGLTIVQNDGTINTNAGVTITKASFMFADGKTYSNVISTPNNNNAISIYYLSSDIWKTSAISNGLSATGTLTLFVTSSINSSEYYIITKSFTIYKRYSIGILPENTFVREGEEIELEHFVDVYDYKLMSYLGKPTITEYEQVKAKVNLGNIYVDEKTSDKKNKTLSSSIGEKITDLSDADKKNDAMDYLNSYGLYQYSTPGEDETLSIANYSMFVGVKAIKKVDGTQITRKLSVNSAISSDGDVTIKLRLGSSDSLFGAGVTSKDYDFEFYLYNTVYQELRKDKIATTIEADIIAQNSTDTTSAIVQANCESVYYLDVKSHSTDAEILVQYYQSGTKNTASVLASSGYLDSLEGVTDLELFTGEYNGVKYINGFNSENVKKAKNIKTLTLDKETLTKYTVPKMSDTSFSIDDDFGVEYQQKTIGNIEIKHYESVSEQYAVNSTEGKLNVTTKFTGVDTTNAYAGAAEIHYVYDDEMKINDDGTINSDSKVHKISLVSWSNGFELIAGVGISQIMAKSEDKSFVANINKTDTTVAGTITFKEGQVFGSGSANDDSLFKIDEKTGEISLYSNFIPNMYYISINVYCHYGDLAKEKLIGTIYLSFVKVDKVDVYASTVNNQTKYEMSIDNFVKGDITSSDIKLGIADNINYTKTETTKTITFGYNNGKLSKGEMLLLEIAGESRYISVNLCVNVSTCKITENETGDEYSYEVTSTFQFDAGDKVYSDIKQQTEITDVSIADAGTGSKITFNVNSQIDNNIYIYHKEILYELQVSKSI